MPVVVLDLADDFLIVLVPDLPSSRSQMSDDETAFIFGLAVSACEHTVLPIAGAARVGLDTASCLQSVRSVKIPQCDRIDLYADRRGTTVNVV